MKKTLLISLLAALFTFSSASAQTMLDQTILFKKDSVNIMESQKDRIGLVVPKEKVDIIGQQRADAVKKYIVETYRIPESRFVAISAGVCTRYSEPEHNEVVSFFTK